MTTIFSHIPNDIDDSVAPWTDLVGDDIHIRVFRDKYPVNPGHLLFVPKFNSMDVLTEAFEHATTYGRLKVKNGEWDGFNVGLNYGAPAGQTVDWPHVHLIPRFDGDCEDPIGGVRNVIPGKGNYRK
jgi:diadenosine tetraphosphate (Ap4A) HIT family hydrolase